MTYVLSKAQRAALKRVFDRQALVKLPNRYGEPSAERAENHWSGLPRLTYRQFRRLAHPSFDCVMVPWCGMWLGIERDGYTHS